MNIDYSGMVSGADFLTHQNKPKGLEQAAKAFESLFINMMLKSARAANETLGGDDLMGGSEMSLYYSMMDSRIATEMSNTGAFGLAEIMMRQFGYEQDPNADKPKGTLLDQTI
ncbi:hypothetical protein GCM10023116_18210 [Kistimonas scapharcae]|uniref:Flagellar protein FlgJ N-terminal domain-containing protein n=1 Tax=Kistimonas scapharcae TaxID=1036133 RepID=A0ABP8V3W2_9GAMM